MGGRAPACAEVTAESFRSWLLTPQTTRVSLMRTEPASYYRQCAPPALTSTCTIQPCPMLCSSPETWESLTCQHVQHYWDPLRHLCLPTTYTKQPICQSRASSSAMSTACHIEIPLRHLLSPAHVTLIPLQVSAVHLNLGGSMGSTGMSCILMMRCSAPLLCWGPECRGLYLR